jgi:hypothetical protein
MTHYVTPYSLIEDHILKTLPAKKGASAAETETLIKGLAADIIGLLIRSVDVDEDWYKTRYPDVAHAIDDGLFQSAKHHFIDSGYKEGRIPGEMLVEEDWYLKTYPDVAESIKNGLFETATSHFELYGYKEGRLPQSL